MAKPLEIWSKLEVMAKEEEEVFSFPTHLSPLDFSDYSGCSPLDFQYGSLQQKSSAVDSFSVMDMLVNDQPLYSSLDVVPSESTVIQGDYLYGSSSTTLGFWSEIYDGVGGFNAQNNQQINDLLEDNNNTDNQEMNGDEKKVMKKGREERNSCSKGLSREILSQYFYMPITQAARELNIGLTLLKKRCRELGIRRWPHRKLMSLQTLINNIQELMREGGQMGDQLKLRDAYERLEHEKKLLEEIPDMDLNNKTKKLRQACFKANYKKRKQMGMRMPHELQLPSNYTINHSGFEGVLGSRYDDGVEEMNSLLSDCFSSSNNLFQF